VSAAVVAVEPYFSLPTPLVQPPVLSELVGAEISLKLEFATPIGVFKLRGVLNLVGKFLDGERAAGLVASTGNHGQSVAYAAQLNGARAVIFVPEGANADKIAAMERLGAEVRPEGDRFDDCIRLALSFTDASRMRFISSGYELALIADVAAVALEVLESQQPEPDVVIVPMGGGSGVSSWCVVRDGLGNSSKIGGDAIGSIARGLRVMA
jgi:threonine dehydratase